MCVDEGGLRLGFIDKSILWENAKLIQGYRE